MMSSSVLQISKRGGPQAGISHARQFFASDLVTNPGPSKLQPRCPNERNSSIRDRQLQEPVPDGAVGEPTRRGGAGPEECTVTLLKWALLFFVISVVAGILGFTGVSAASADIARILFYIFLVIFLVLLILGLTIFRV
jgi:uncharacterized membrane protein YtjA (UPF0391 family)